MRWFLVVMVGCARPSQPVPITTTTPTVVEEVTTAPQLRAGANHTCVVTAGEVTCWGNGVGGQIGDGMFVDRARPMKVAIHDVTDVTLGLVHTCARQQSGAVWCWGTNVDGQLGDGTTDDHPTPVRVENLQPAVEISAGHRHTCARHADGSVSCWGSNVNAQLGDGSLENRLAPGLVAGITDAIALASGENFTCALRRAGTVACWGENSSGQLGVALSRDDAGVRVLEGSDPHFDDGNRGRFRWLYTLPITIPDIFDARTISGAEHHVCVVRGSDRVTCWGDQVAPMDVQQVKGAVEVVTGGETTCARLSNMVACWGVLPMPRPILVPLTGVPQQIAIGRDHACARTSDGVQCWGENTLSQLGTGTPTNRYIDEVDELSHTTSLAVAGLIMCGLDGDDVTCLGAMPARRRLPIHFAHATQLVGGVASLCGILPSKQVACVNTFHGQRQVIRGVEGAVELVAGEARVCARLETGKVTCWSWGERTASQIEELDEVTHVAVGNYATCATRKDGHIACVGSGREGTLGDGLHEDTTGTAAIVADLDHVDELVAGLAHMCARKGGNVWCWGRGEEGQLGDGKHERRARPVRVLIDDAVTLSASSDHTCAIRKSGQVACWGADFSGELAIDNPVRGANHRGFAAPQDIPMLDNIRSIVLTPKGGCAQRNNGEVVCWPRFLVTNSVGSETKPQRVSF